MTDKLLATLNTGIFLCGVQLALGFLIVFLMPLVSCFRFMPFRSGCNSTAMELVEPFLVVGKAFFAVH